MPKRMLWTERLFQLIPVGKEYGSFASLLWVRLIRSLCLTFVYFLVSVPVWLLMGITTHAYDTLTLTGILYIFVVLFLTFVVSGWFHNKWDWFFGWSSHILKMNETEFDKFRDKRERFVQSSSACLIITLIMYVTAMPTFLESMNKQVGPFLLRPAVFLIDLAVSNFFMFLLMGTLIWIIVSMWITFYITLRQPLNLKLSPRTDEQFRPLAIWSLKVLFVTFVLVAVVVIFTNLGVIQMVGGFASYVGSLIFLVTLGVLAFLLPFYNVHRVLVNLKKRELREIEGESNKLMQDLAQTASNSNALHSEESMTQIMNSQRALISLQLLQIREKRTKEADEWPIDTTILSILVGIVLVPILSQTIINLLSTIFTS